MANSISKTIKPKSTIFDPSKWDAPFEITQLRENPDQLKNFFDENFTTENMKRLFIAAFKRFEGNSEQFVIKLTQTMGGGKTHNMIALGLLAQNPLLREKNLKPHYDYSLKDDVKVLVFSGRENKITIAESLAKQLKKEVLFADIINNREAPAPGEWISLLKGKPTLILLDELPPYFKYATTVTLGMGTLADRTTTSLANLLIALSKPELNNVCLVISTLEKAYQEGNERVSEALSNAANEINRVPLINLEPVQMNSDDVYSILRKKIFEDIDLNSSEIDAIADAYAKELENAKQAGINILAPHSIKEEIKKSYPFHPSIKELYARFSQNQNFQQTRGVIRLMKKIVADLWLTNKANELLLIGAHDYNLNNRDVAEEIVNINDKLKNAIDHDIAREGGGSIAEKYDIEKNSSAANDFLKLSLIASLSNVPNADVGLNESEIVKYLSRPNANYQVASVIADTAKPLLSLAWYLHENNEGKLFIKDVQNLNAKINSYSQNLSPEQIKDFLKIKLEELFKPEAKDCYQDVIVFPNLSSLRITQDRVSLIIYPPQSSAQLHPDLQRFYDSEEFQNRMIFLSGQQTSMVTLENVGREMLAIIKIIEDYDKQGTAKNDPNYRDALNRLDIRISNLLMAAQSTFTWLYYPLSDGIVGVGFRMQFTGNLYKGEDQIRKTLREEQKFDDDIFQLESDIFRQKVEARLFTTNPILWSEILRKAASNASWQFTPPDALQKIKLKATREGKWKELEGNRVEKGPFPPPRTEVFVKEISRDSKTGIVILDITPRHGNRIHVELNGNPASPASMVADEPSRYETSEMKLSFLCTDSNGKSETGNPVTWLNRIELKYEWFNDGTTPKCKLQAIPDANITYTTNGDDPKENGGKYDEPFSVEGIKMIKAVAQKQGIFSKIAEFIVPDKTGPTQKRIDPMKPLTWKLKKQFDDNSTAYDFYKNLKEIGAFAIGADLNVVVADDWMRLNTQNEMKISGEQLELFSNQLLDIMTNAKIVLKILGIYFSTGAAFTEWINRTHINYNPNDIQQ
jgi:hypothetical protein